MNAFLYDGESQRGEISFNAEMPVTGIMTVVFAFKITEKPDAAPDNVYSSSIGSYSFQRGLVGGTAPEAIGLSSMGRLEQYRASFSVDSLENLGMIIEVTHPDLIFEVHIMDIFYTE